MKWDVRYFWEGLMREFELMDYPDVSAQDWFGCYNMGGEL